MMILWLLACRNIEEPERLPIPDADIYVDNIGDPIPSISDDLQESYQLGASVMTHSFTPETGLGPSFNADSCASCHQMPVPGGSAP